MLKTLTMSRKTALWLLAAAALLALTWLARREPSQLASVARVVRAPLEQSFVEEGKTRIKQRYLLSAPVAGMVRRIELQAGDAVRTGQLLAEIDPVSSALLDPRARAQALADISNAESAALAARQRSAAAGTADEVAQREWQRLRQLRAAGVVTESQLDAARSQAAMASADVGVAAADEQIARRRLQAAQAALAEEGRAGRGKVLRVVAPVDGVILKRLVDSAMTVPAGQPLMELGDPAALEIEVQALSTDAVRLQPGMRARVLRWGGDDVLDASVARIEPGGFTQVSALGVQEQRTRVILDLRSPRRQWAALGDGFRVEVEFIVRQDSEVLQIPASALFRADAGWAVYRLDGKTARLTPVQLGARSALAVEILAGLQLRQQVVVQPDDRIKDGTRIDAVPAR
jgi:HlyD family secretion protein